MSSGFVRVVARDLRLALRQRADAGMVVLFFVLTAALFPFGVGPEANLLARIAPGIIWVTALLAVLLSLERLFLADYEDGALELLALSPLPLEFTVLAKALAPWLTTGLPLLLPAPLLALLLVATGVEGFSSSPEVRPGTEAAARARDDHGAHIVVGVDLVEHGQKISHHLLRERIQAIRPVEGEGHHAILYFGEQRLVGHRPSPWSSRYARLVQCAGRA